MVSDRSSCADNLTDRWVLSICVIFGSKKSRTSKKRQTSSKTCCSQKTWYVWLALNIFDSNWCTCIDFNVLRAAPCCRRPPLVICKSNWCLPTPKNHWTKRLQKTHRFVVKQVGVSCCLLLSLFLFLFVFTCLGSGPGFCSEVRPGSEQSET